MLLASGPDIYVAATQTAEPRELRLDVTVGNSGTHLSRSNFDAFLELQESDQIVCSKATNFLTPFDPGQAVRAFRLLFHAPAQTGAKRTQYTVTVHTHFWDDQRTSDIDRRNNHAKVLLSVPAGSKVDCILLKPIQ